MARKTVKRKRPAAANARKTKTRKKAARASARKASSPRRKVAPKGKTAKKKKTAKRPARKKVAASRRARPARRPATKVRAAKAKRASTPARRGGTGREETLAQTPEAGRSVKGRTNPMPTRRSTGTAAGAGNTRRAPGLERARRQLREVEESVPGIPSSLDLDRRPSAARSGRQHLREAREDHNEVSPDITAGDVDASWEDAYSTGDEAPGGDNPTPDQDRVDDIGKALGVEYNDNEELKASDKIAERDRKRWELDPASSDDYKDRD